MRELKFRGKDAATGRWIYGDSIKHTDNADGSKRGYSEQTYIGSKIPNARKVGAMKWNVVDPSTIGQYTGLKDKNGTEIYEGDKVTIKGAVSATVEWSNFGFHLYGLEDVSGRRPDYAFSDFNQIEVIGNIHERKEQ